MTPSVAGPWVRGMSDTETDRRMAELETLLNDPEVRLDADRVWTLLAEIRTRMGVAVRRRG